MNMNWFDPKNWVEDPAHGLGQIEVFADHFASSLQETPFNKVNSGEWKRFRVYVQVNFGELLGTDKIEAKGVWKNVFKYRCDQFPNLSLLAQIILILSPSNSSVERAFSVLTSVLTDRRISMKHTTLEMVIRIHGNDKQWSEEERCAIIERAIDIHLQKRRLKRLDKSPPKPQKKARYDAEVSVIQSSSESSCNDEISSMDEFLSSDDGSDDESLSINVYTSGDETLSD